MLFRKRIAPSCSYCSHGTKIGDEEILCAKRGVVSCDSSCYRFSYDPTKRIPLKAKPLDFRKYDEEDYSL